MTPPRPAASANSADSADSPRGAIKIPSPSDDVVDALVVQSWSECTSGNVLWEKINNTWMDLGDTPLHIDFSSRPACFGTVRYDDLVASGADVLILSDAAGAIIDLKRPEKKAIKRYAQEGHGVFSTFAEFRNKGFRNRSLAPLLGIDTKFSGDLPSLKPSYSQLDLRSPLFLRISDPYVSKGWPYAQVPKDESWDDDDLATTARYVAKTADGKGVVIVNEEPGLRSVYISSMPEFGGASVDAQFIYNALTFVADTTADNLSR